jgi:hypothetical protein
MSNHRVCRPFFLKRFIAQKVCGACSRTSYIIVPLTNLNNYLHNDTSKTEVSVITSVNLAVKNSKINTAAVYSPTRALTW